MFYCRYKIKHKFQRYLVLKSVMILERNVYDQVDKQAACSLLQCPDILLKYKLSTGNSVHRSHDGLHYTEIKTPTILGSAHLNAQFVLL